MLYRFMRILVDLERRELPGLLLAFGCAASMFTAYSMLRSVRDAMGVTSGVESLPFLFWMTFAITLLLQPIYGWVLSRFSRAIALPAVYIFVAATLIGFYGWFYLQSDHTWIARTYFVWVSVFNLFIIAVFWSLMADIFDREQAGRVYGFLAGGISFGGLLGPGLAASLAKPFGTVSLLLVAAILFFTSGILMWRVVQWRSTQPEINLEEKIQVPLKAKPWDAFQQVTRSPYLSLISVFVLLLTFVSTILYLEQQRVIALAIPDKDAQTQLFATIDFYVQAASLAVQFIFFPRLMRWLNFKTLLVSIPGVMVLAFIAFTFSPSLPVIIGAMSIRRIGEYGVTRPCRDMLFTVVSSKEKYMAKSLIDTFVYRGGDAVSSSLYTGVVAITASVPFGGAAPGLFGIVISLLWVSVSLFLAKRFTSNKMKFSKMSA
jgi:ATP:ADP antiporter, AAA family